MSYKPIPTKCWERFLLQHGFKYKRTTASHDQWSKPGVLRPIVFRGKDKEIPAFHISTCLKTMGYTQEYFEKWVKENY